MCKLPEHLDEQCRSSAGAEQLRVNLTFTGVQMRRVALNIHIFQAYICIRIIQIYIYIFVFVLYCVCVLGSTDEDVHFGDFNRTVFE